MRLILACGTIAVASALSWPQTPATPEQEIKIIEARWLEAILDSDRPTLDGILAEDYVAVHSNGLVMNKEQDIALTVSRGFSMPAQGLGGPLGDLRTRVFGDAAVTTGGLTLVRSRGVEPEFRRFTHVFVRHNGRWQCVSSHLAVIPLAEVARQREMDRIAHHQVWTAQQPAHYRFTVAVRSTQTAIMEVRQGQTVAMTEENGKALENVRPWDRLNTIDKVFEMIRSAQAADVLEVTYDGARGNPAMVFIDTEPFTQGDEFSADITKFTVLPD